VDLVVAHPFVELKFLNYSLVCDRIREIECLVPGLANFSEKINIFTSMTTLSVTHQIEFSFREKNRLTATEHTTRPDCLILVVWRTQSGNITVVSNRNGRSSYRNSLFFLRLRFPIS
jgi:hypothetical protein